MLIEWIVEILILIPSARNMIESLESDLFQSRRSCAVSQGRVSYTYHTLAPHICVQKLEAWNLIMIDGKAFPEMFTILIVWNRQHRRSGE